MQNPAMLAKETLSPRSAEDLFVVSIPPLDPFQKLDIKSIRDPLERFYMMIIWAVNILVLIGLIIFAYYDVSVFLVVILYGVLIAIFYFISCKLMYWFLYGHGIVVGPNQYPQIYRLVHKACYHLDIPLPTIIILQGHGLFELIVAKFFTRRGVIIMTSNMIDEFSKKFSSRELMMYIGRQLGLIKMRFFHFEFCKHVVGRLALFFQLAWKRRCHLTADRIGLLISGDLYASEQALYIITVGAGIAPSTNYDEIFEQRARLFESFWAWLRLGFSTYPYMVDRIVRLRHFAELLGKGSRPNVGVIPLEHHPLRSLPLLIIHGHDRVARLELENFLYSQFPYVSPRLMVNVISGAVTLPEKLEATAAEVYGAIALLTPDDVGGLVAEDDRATHSRARQNVVIEIGWIWGKLGRQRCLLLARGDIELPSDLSGTDLLRFHESPVERAEDVRTFINQLNLSMRP